MKNYKAGANRHWQAIATSQKWADRTAKPIIPYVVGGINGKLSEEEMVNWAAKRAGVAIDQIKTAKDGRKYFLVNGKVNYEKGFKPLK